MIEEFKPDCIKCWKILSENLGGKLLKEIRKVRVSKKALEFYTHWPLVLTRDYLTENPTTEILSDRAVEALKKIEAIQNEK